MLADDITRVGRPHHADKMGMAAVPSWAAAHRGGGNAARPHIVARSPSMRSLCERLAVVAASPAPVLLQGETGTGKELLANAIHEQSGRARGPLVAVNCAAIPESLIEAELFGHERGAFTGADRARIGRFQAAHGGTLFLDEVGELPMATQAKLLRVLQEERIEPLGGNRSVPVDIRMVYATHRDLRSLVASGQFREDLFYRVRVIELHVPSLRERPEDLDELIDQFLLEGRLNGHTPVLTPEARRRLHEHRFPGNVRELKHAITHGVVMAGGLPIRIEHLPAEIQGGARTPKVEPRVLERPRTLAEVLAEAEALHIRAVLDLCHGNRVRTAQVLGISRKTLWEKIRGYGIDIHQDGRQRM